MKVKDIIVKKRIRKDLGNLSLLKNSIEKYGLLSPLVVNSKGVLIAGERRLTVIKELGWEEVTVVIKDISYKEALAIEIDENITRKDFETIELAQGLQKKHKLNRNIFLKIGDFFKELWNKILKNGIKK